MTGQLVHLAVWVGLSVMGAEPQATSSAPVPGGGLDAPWTQVSRQEQDKGMELFQQANQALHESELRQAVELYRQALTHWDHPAFHYNLAIALLTTSSVLESHEHLEAATRYGPEPLDDPEKYRNAMSILAEVEGHLTRLELTCDEPGAQVTVNDRKDLFSCPGSYVQWTQPGIHIVRIMKDGFHPTTKSLTLRPGERYALPLRLYTQEAWTRTRTRWPWWIPWAVMGGGAAALTGGGVLHGFSASQFQAYDTVITTCAPPPTNATVFVPCQTSPELERLLARANATQAVAWGLYASGAAVVVSALVLQLLNVPQSYLVDPETGKTLESTPSIAIGPMLVPGSRGVVLVGSF